MNEANRWFFLLLFAAVMAFFLLLQPILMPFIAALLLSYLCDPMVTLLARKTGNRTVAVVIVMASFFFFVTVALMIVVPLLQAQIGTFIATVPEIVNWLAEKILPFVQQKMGTESLVFPQPSQLQEVFVQHWQQAGQAFSNVLTVITRSGLAFSLWVVNLLLIPVVMFYLLKDWPLLLTQIGQAIPRVALSTVTHLAKKSDEVLGAFIRGQLLVMLALALTYSLGLSAVGLKMAILVGLLAGLLSIVPYLGFAVGFMVAMLIAFFQFSSALMWLAVVVVFIVGQILEGFVLTPLLIGEKIGLHPVVIIFAIMAGGQLFAFTGTLLALPAAAVIKVLLDFAYQRYLSSELYVEKKI